MKIDGNQIKVGNILEINSKLWRVLKTQHTQPGKGGAYLQVEMKGLQEGTKINERFRSSESVERAILDEKICQYLYSENNKFIFMDISTYEQVEIGNDIIQVETTAAAPVISERNAGCWNVATLWSIELANTILNIEWSKVSSPTIAVKFVE